MPEPVQIIRTLWSVGKCSLQSCWARGIKKTKLVATLKKFYGRHHDLVNPYNVAVSRIVSYVFASDAPEVDFPNPGRTLLPIFHSFRPIGMVGEACLPSNAYYPRTPDYTLCSGVQVCWSEHSDSPFVYGFMSLDYGFGTITATTFKQNHASWNSCTDRNYFSRQS